MAAGGLECLVRAPGDDWDEEGDSDAAAGPGRWDRARGGPGPGGRIAALATTVFDQAMPRLLESLLDLSALVSFF